MIKFYKITVEEVLYNDEPEGTNSSLYVRDKEIYSQMIPFNNFDLSDIIEGANKRTKIMTSRE